MADDIKKYPLLYRLNPSFYGRLWRADMFLANFFFCFRHLGIIKPYVFVEKQIMNEYKEIEGKLKKASRAIKGYPADLAVSSLAGLVLYSTIRKMKPDVVLETGVAYGYSTYMILSALNKNGRGRLISTEIKKYTFEGPKIGILLSSIDRSRWTLVVGKPQENLDKALGMVEKINIFIHDSDHSYKNMMFEYRRAYSKMKGGLMMSDDIYWRTGDARSKRASAFLDFAKRINARPTLFPRGMKTFGVIRV